MGVEHLKVYDNKMVDSPLFIPFIMAGDPSLEATIEIALALQDSGAAILELGIPYSDPLADGPVIQRSAVRALAGGMTLSKSLGLVKKMRERGLSIPVILFTYLNPVLQFGFRELTEQARQSGVNGLLVPDLPYEESAELKKHCSKNELHLISLVAPTTKHERLKEIVGEATGFLYCVSSLGVTGERNSFHQNLFDFLQQVKSLSTIPVAVGFGVSQREQFELLRQHADGIIIGSAIVKEVEKLAELFEREQKVAITEFKKAIGSLLPARVEQSNR